MQESHFLGLLLIQQEIDVLALITEFALRVGNLRVDIYQISPRVFYLLHIIYVLNCYYLWIHFMLIILPT